MRTAHKELRIETEGDADVIDITKEVKKALKESGLSSGLATLFIRGSTGSITTIEYEPNLVKDLKDAFDRLIPKDCDYAHTLTWGDHNGHSHIRASFLGPSLQVPFEQKELQLGTWQQIVLIDFDTHPRERRVFLQFIGE